MFSAPVLAGNREHEVPLLEQDAVVIAQRIAGIIGIRSL